MEIAMLIQLVRAGDEAAVVEFYNVVCDKCYPICCKLVKVEADAPDLFHDVLLYILYEQLKKTSFTCEEKFKAWCGKMTVNKAKEFERKRKRTVDIEDALWVGIDGERKQMGAFVYKILQDCINMLPPRSREVFSLIAEEDCSHEEVSNLLDISEGASKSYYSRARIMMQKLLIKKGISNGDRF